MSIGYSNEVAVINGQQHAIVNAWPDSLAAKSLTDDVVNAFLACRLITVEAFGSRFPAIVKELRRDTDTFEVDVAGERHPTKKIDVSRAK
jgi:hypothetical protein